MTQALFVEKVSSLPGGVWLNMHIVKDEAEAAALANGREYWLHRSLIIDALYVFIRAEVEQ